MPTGIYKRKPLSEETKRKIGLANSIALRGRKIPKQQVEKLRKRMIGNKFAVGSKGRSGNKSNFWKGGITPLRRKIYNLGLWKQWRSDVFQRDKWTCQTCGYRGGKLQAHHIKSFSDILSEYNITKLEDAIQCDELWDTDNGVTLCEECHKLTDNYGFKQNRKN